MSKQRAIGQYEVSERGIERVIDVGDCGSYTTELIMPKDVFIEAYKRFVESEQADKESEE